MSTYRQGVDLSSYQHPNGAPIDFTEAHATGWDFAVIKATEGASYQNPYFAADVKAALAAGFDVDAYHWVSPASSAADQVANVLRVLKAAGFGSRVWLDFEQSRDTHAVLDGVRAGLRSAGLRTGTYVYPEFWREYGDHTCQACAADPLWLAWDFPEEPTLQAVAARGFTIAPWSAVSLWQYAGSSVSVPGIPGLQDANRLLCPLPDLLSPSRTQGSQSPAEEENVFELIHNTVTEEIWAWSAGGAWWHIPNPDWGEVALRSSLCKGQRDVGQQEFDLLKAVAASARGVA